MLEPLPTFIEVVPKMLMDFRVRSVETEKSLDQISAVASFVSETQGTNRRVIYSFGTYSGPPSSNPVGFYLAARLLCDEFNISDEEFKEWGIRYYGELRITPTDYKTTGRGARNHDGVKVTVENNGVFYHSSNSDKNILIESTTAYLECLISVFISMAAKKMVSVAEGLRCIVSEIESLPPPTLNPRSNSAAFRIEPVDAKVHRIEIESYLEKVQLLVDDLLERSKKTDLNRDDIESMRSGLEKSEDAASKISMSSKILSYLNTILHIGYTWVGVLLRLIGL